MAPGTPTAMDLKTCSRDWFGPGIEDMSEDCTGYWLSEKHADDMAKAMNIENAHSGLTRQSTVDSTADERERHTEEDVTDCESTQKDVTDCESTRASAASTCSRSHLDRWAEPSETLVIFDWDDTLCPTSWIRQILKDHMADQWHWAVDEGGCDFDWQNQIPAWFGQPLPDLPDVRDAIRRVQEAVIHVINVAQTLGVVCIVTNAFDGWVCKTTKKWLPQLKQYIMGHGARPPITVLYGQQQYRRPSPESAASSLSWVDGLGELTWWKKAAMVSALAHVRDLYRVDPSAASCCAGPDWLPEAPEAAGPALPEVSWQADRGAKGIASVLSIGDSEAEMQASELAALVHGRRDRGAPSTGPGCGRRRPLSAPPGGRSSGKPWVKNLKFREGPSVDQIVEQLNHLARALPQIVAARSHLRLSPEDLAAMLASSSSEDAETRLQRLLRTQTI
mmetsp:Transcript_11370/g.35499  ORF Transcript_11370/g.35499 Transcript_11370/m.35499 type:complete len:448 (-) Transcript_11370:74-1417(-)